MSRVEVVVPESRLVPALAPLVAEARWRGIPVSATGCGADVVVGLDGFLPPARHRIAVDNWFDCFTHPPVPEQTMCYTSPFHRDTHGRLWDSRSPGHVVGWLHAHTYAEVKREFAAFFLPKLRIPNQERRRGWFTAYYMRALFTARRAARAQGLILVVKTRSKIGSPWWLRFVPGTVLLSDETDSISLLSMSRWCVHFGSAAAFEAAYAGAFAYWYPAPEEHLRHVRGTELRPAMFSWPGVSRMGAPGNDAISSWERDAYLSHYLGYYDGKAAERVLDLAESIA